MGNLNSSNLSSSSLAPVKQRPNERGNLLEYSVVYTDRAVNLMCEPFQVVMRDISRILKQTYNAPYCAVIPGSGTYAMEAVARQFGTSKKCMVIRNGYFSFRWSDIFDVCSIPSSSIVLKAQFDKPEDGKPTFAPFSLDEALERIKAEKPAVVFAPQVETSTGIILPEDYIKKLANAVHEVGGLFVLDAIAAGTIWVDMEALGVDVLISAPQKGWSGPACCGLVMLNERAKQAMQSSKPTSFCCNLAQWLTVMEKYENGGFMYYTTLPTDSLTSFRNAMLETVDYGTAKSKDSAVELGTRVRQVFASKGYKSVAADEVAAPTVVVVYSKEPQANMVAKFKEAGLQIAAGVPFKVDEPEGLNTFRIGLFGLDKLKNVSRTVQAFEEALAKCEQ